MIKCEHYGCTNDAAVIAFYNEPEAEGVRSSTAICRTHWDVNGGYDGFAEGVDNLVATQIG